MERENFYLLLELPLDTPVTDAKKIEEAIEKKQKEWSRLRTHPTKSIEAKKNIGLIPEIKKVLSDPNLLKKEIELAKTIIISKEKDKFAVVDRHIKLLMSKGSITKKGITELAKIHNISEDEISKKIKKNEKLYKIDREISLLISKGHVSDKSTVKLAKQFSISKDKISEQIKKKEEEKFSPIDRYLKNRLVVGFVPESAITNLSKIFSVREGKILEHIECPIRPEGEKRHKKIELLEHSLVELIERNLKIVKREDLYDYLELPPNTPIVMLLDKAKEKENEARRIGQKDAVVTASGTLAGQCLVIFKNEKTKNAYDTTLEQSHLKQLDQEIIVAGIGGKIYVEYMEMLVSYAIQKGIEFEEAVEYIKEFCEKEKWVIEEKKKLVILKKNQLVIWEKWTIDLNPKKPSFWILVAAGVLIILTLGLSVVTTKNIIQSARLRSAYNNVLSSLEQKDLNQQEKVLQDFLNRYGTSKYADSVKKEIQKIREKIELEDYQTTLKESEKFIVKNNFEEAKKIYDWYLGKHPNKAHSAEIKKQADRIPELIDDRDYEVLKKMTGTDYSQKIRNYNSYFANHPQGKHIEDVKKLILNLVQQYYDILNNDLVQCEKAEQWEKCIKLCNDFIQKFSGTEQSSVAEGNVIKYQKRIQFQNELADLKKQSDEKGFDFASAAIVYQEYLKANPEAPAYVKEKVDGELANIEKRKQQYIREEKEWDEIRAYAGNSLVSLNDRIQRVQRYNTPERHQKEFGELLTELKNKKKVEDERNREEREKKDWRDTLLLTNNANINYAEKIAKVEKFLRDYPSTVFLNEASSLLNDLKQKKAALDNYLMQQEMERARIQGERNRLRASIRNSGRYVDNGNDTFTDKKTGLMWCLMDSSVLLGRCTDFQTSKEYIEKLNIGGYTDWRFPTVNELASIYKTDPFFPSFAEKWFWSSEILWHGWNKVGFVLTSKQETAWTKMQVELTKCGAVHPVRSSQ